MLRHLLAATLVAAVTSALAWLIGRARPAQLSTEAGSIRPERVSAAAVVLGGLMLASIGVLGALSGRWLLGVAIILLGLGLAGFTAPSFTRLHVLSWTPDGVEGPSRTFGPTLGRARTTIAWRDIASAGKAANGYWYIQSADGRRIHWSWLHKGWRAFNAALELHRPGLTDDLSRED